MDDEHDGAIVIGTGETRGFMKAIVDADSGQILGCAVLGSEGGEIMTMIQIAMLGKLTHTDMAEAILTHLLLAQGPQYPLRDVRRLTEPNDLLIRDAERKSTVANRGASQSPRSPRFCKRTAASVRTRIRSWHRLLQGRRRSRQALRSWGPWGLGSLGGQWLG